LYEWGLKAKRRKTTRLVFLLLVIGFFKTFNPAPGQINKSIYSISRFTTEKQIRFLLIRVKFAQNHRVAAASKTKETNLKGISGSESGVKKWHLTTRHELTFSVLQSILREGKIASIDSTNKNCIVTTTQVPSRIDSESSHL
jgi:hypothetical protein